jgi:four helix bundle protein
MRSQITRAAVSIPSNIAEGWTRESNKEKAQFLSMAQGSLAEMETQLTLCERIGWLKPELTVDIRGLIVEVGKMLSALRQKLRGRIVN